MKQKRRKNSQTDAKKLSKTNQRLCESGNGKGVWHYNGLYIDLFFSDHTAHAKPPILDMPLPHKNVSDVVVIETRRLKIIENKAVLPLAIFLVLAILLLFVVALRLRIVKSKLKRRPFATDDADYLINGMYL